MIYTVTLNPAIDYAMHVDNLTAGQVNRSHGEYVLYGGKGINVSTVLHNLGVESIALGFVAGFTGKEIENGVKNLGVQTDFIHLNSGLSRINVKVKGTKETDINAAGPEISKDELEQLFKKLDKIKDGDTLILAGTIPKSVSEDIYEQFIERISGKNVNVVVDATKELLLNVLKYRPFLIKPNNHELAEMFGKTSLDEEQMNYYAGKLQDMGAKNVLVSMAGDGAVLFTENKKVYKIGVAKGQVVNSVGAGDSMVAGFVASYFKDRNYEKALKYATAAGGATAFLEGLATKEKTEELLKQL